MTNKSTPYWTIRSSGNTGLGSGAAELRKLLEAIEATLQNDNSKDKTIIGIFDNDMKGNQEFNGLKKDLFAFWNNSLRIKKHKEYNVFAIKLPIPENKGHYLREKQKFLFFSIEHYFPVDFLQSKDILVAVKDFTDIYAIKDKKKQTFAELVKMK